MSIKQFAFSLPHNFFSFKAITVTVAEVALCLITLYLLKSWLSLRQLPPGPRGLPLVGNIRDLPTERPWLFWAKHRDLYGM